MATVPVRYPNRIRECIKLSGYTVQEVAAKTDIPVRTLFDYCAGRTAIPRERLEMIAELTGYPIEYLIPIHVNINDSSSATTLLWNVPHKRNPFFTGREQLLQHLRDTLHTDGAAVLTHPQVISGLGGVGKTHIAIEYAYRYHQDYEAIFWIKADTRENLLADFMTIAQFLNLLEQHAEEQALAVAAVIQWFKTHPKWLLIFDNADDLAMVQQFMPPALGGHILLTTRAQAVGRLAQRIDVECMTPEVGALFLLRRASLIAPGASLEQASPAQCESAVAIVRELGGLPLALDQAGAYIEESSYHLEGYLKLYRRQRAALLNRRGGFATDHPAPVATTWSLSFERVEQADPVAADLLRLCAFLDPDAIPEEILLEGAREPGSQTESVSLDQLRVNEAIEVLLRFSLIRRNAETGTLTIHRLVQAVLQDTMDKEMQRLWAERTVRAVNRAISRTITAYSTSGHPHRAVQLLKTSIYIHQERGDKEGGVWAYRALCALLTEDISSALTAARCARELADVGREERDIIRSEWLLGWVFVRLACEKDEQITGNLQEAELHLQEALDRCRRINMVDYEADLLLAWARLHHAKGDRHLAKVHAIEALAITNRSDFCLLRADVNNLFAQLEMDDGNWQEAKDHAQAALADAICDGSPYCYMPALVKAERLLDQIKHFYPMEISH
jgi:transcriptional regulator with XRE-family HTH domain/tetratricopeptide (TPR) repeat protein